MRQKTETVTIVTKNTCSPDNRRPPSVRLAVRGTETLWRTSHITHISYSHHTPPCQHSLTPNPDIYILTNTHSWHNPCFTFIISRSMPSPERQWTRQYKNKDIFKSVNNAIISKFWLYVTHVMNKKIIISKIGGTNTEQNTIRNYCIRAQRLYIHRLY